MSEPKKKGVVNLLQEFSIPLLLGVVAAVIFANVDHHAYHEFVHWMPFGEHAEIWGHHLTFHFLINDIFMVFFFGIAAKEITESILPGGDLNPPSKALNPLMATVGGVLGPVAVFFVLAMLFYNGSPEYGDVANGWGVPTATDIALAWLVARMVFGATHPAVKFLLLLAIADDAIGLIIIAVFYPDPHHPAEPMYLGLMLLGMLVAYGMRKKEIHSWVPYVAVGGVLSWAALMNAHLHPALALVPIVPFLPGPQRDTGLFKEQDIVDEYAEVFTGHDEPDPAHHSTLHNFEHHLKLFVDFGLFFFGLANAGVVFSSINNVTWIILASLLLGKTLGVSFFSFIASKMGMPYPSGMRIRHVMVAGIVAGLGLTVALFVAGEAYPGDSIFQGPAKMGALLSGVAGLIAIVVGKMLKVEELEAD